MSFFPPFSFGSACTIRCGSWKELTETHTYMYLSIYTYICISFFPLLSIPISTPFPYDADDDCYLYNYLIFFSIYSPTFWSIYSFSIPIKRETKERKKGKKNWVMLHSPKSVVERRFFLSLGLSRSWLFGSYSSYYYCIARYFFFSLLPSYPFFFFPFRFPYS